MVTYQSFVIQTTSYSIMLSQNDFMTQIVKTFNN